MLSSDDVAAAYRILLGREPESEAVAHNYTPLSAAEMLQAIGGSDEFKAKPQDPLRCYVATFDAPGLIASYVNPDRATRPGHWVNCLGAAVNTKFATPMAGMEGVVEATPFSANWHTCIAEFAAALRAVDLAPGPGFTVAELGCGWGCWLLNTSVAARRKGLRTHAIGVEGEANYLEFCREAMRTNGFSPAELTLHSGVAAADPGMAFFPVQRPGENSWGLEPVFTDDPARTAQLRADPGYAAMDVVPLSEALKPHDRVDLLHIDIQGGESDLIAGAADLMDQKVAYTVIGTHSRIIDGFLVDVLSRHGWVLEIERPTIIRLGGEAPLTLIDGVQGWRNPRLV